MKCYGLTNINSTSIVINDYKNLKRVKHFYNNINPLNSRVINKHVYLVPNHEPLCSENLINVPKSIAFYAKMITTVDV